ncbi:MAG: hypothetical protein WEF50_12405 [Myxococcota bacterium]
MTAAWPLVRLSALALALSVAGSEIARARPLLWQTNSNGDDLHIFDLESRKLVRRLEVGPEPHGIAASADGRYVYVSLEANGRPHGELLWIDPRSYEIRYRMTLCREPHALATTPDGRWIYIPCRDEHYWVVDAEKRVVVARIRTGGRPHNTRVSRDGRFVYLSPMGAPKRVTIVDVSAGHSVVGEIPFGSSVRPSALSEDGRLFHHVDGLNGFRVADVERRELVATVEHRTPLGWLLVHPKLGWFGPDGLQRCHGLAVRPDQREVWSACGASVTVHAIDGARYPEVARIELPGKAYWLTFSPDDRFALVALAEADEVAMVDTASRRIVAHLLAGAAPKRNLVIDLETPPARQSLFRRRTGSSIRTSRR